MRFNHRKVEEINILASANFTAFTYQIPADLGVESEDGCRKVVPAGTVYPSNDGEAIGVLLNDIDVTDGDREGSVIVSGILLQDRLPEPISEEALAAMKKISIKEVIE